MLHGGKRKSVRRPKLPITLGGIAVTAYLRWLERQDGIDYATVFGYEPAEVRDETGRNTRWKKKVPERAFTEAFAAHAYHGGENIAFWVGVYDSST